MHKLEKKAKDDKMSVEDNNSLAQEIGCVGILWGQLAGRITHMDNTKEINVPYTSTMGRIMEIQPSLVTKVSFLDLPVVWYPTTLVNERVTKDKTVSVMVPVCLFEIKGGNTNILNNKMKDSFNDIFQTNNHLPSSNVGKN